MATINGSGGDDTINGTAAADSIATAGGNDSVSGGAGNDSIYAGSGLDTVSGGLGDDSIDGEGGGDSLSGGDGRDTIDGGAGDDIVSGDAGNDSLIGGLGNDTIDGGDGNDILIDDDGNNVMYGGDGDDQIYSNGSASTIDGGSGRDTLVGGSEGDSVSGGDDDDTIYANGGDDTVKGGSGNDSIDGGTGSDVIHSGEGHDTVFAGGGNDQVQGGAGNDYIQGDSGQNTIEGGTGNDTVAGGSGADTFVVRDGDGSDTIQLFSTANDIVAFDMAEIATYQDVLDRMSASGNNTVINFDNGNTLTFVDIQPVRLSASNFAYSAGPVCLLAGTPIRTERGDIPIEELRPDDILWTKDRGWQALRLVVHESLVFRSRDDPAKPIVIPQGALGAGLPRQDLIVSPQHRVLQVLEKTGEEVLVPAIKLAGQNGIRQMRGRKRAQYLNVVLEDHSIIQAAGCWVESMLVTGRSMSRQSKAARRLLDSALGMKPARSLRRRPMSGRRLKTG